MEKRHGLFVNDEPLDNYLLRQGQQERAAEASQIRKEIIAGMAKSRLKYSRCEFTLPKKAANRAHYLTPRQIRKEYGIMASPKQTVMENLLCICSAQGPLTILEMARMLGSTRPRIQSSVIRMHKRIPHLLIRTGKGSPREPYQYQLLAEISPEAAYLRYLADGKRGGRNAALEEAKETPVKLQAEPQVLKVEVSGSIQILFGFTK